MTKVKTQPRTQVIIQFPGKPNESAYEDLEKIFQLKATLHKASPAIWRSILFPGVYSFYDLHLVIQACMGWNEEQPFSFNVGGRRFEGAPWEEPEANETRESEVDLALGTIKFSIGSSFTYSYGYENSWKITIEVEAVGDVNPAEVYPQLLEGAGASPTESFGDLSAYVDFVKALGNPLEREEVKELAGDMDVDLSSFDPNEFEADPIDERLQYLAEELAWEVDEAAPAGPEDEPTTEDLAPFFNEETAMEALDDSDFDDDYDDDLFAVTDEIWDDPAGSDTDAARTARVITAMVANQIQTGAPPEVGRTLIRLVKTDMSEDEALRLIACAWTAEMYAVIRDNRDFDEDRYLALLNNLPDLP